MYGESVLIADAGRSRATGGRNRCRLSGSGRARVFADEMLDVGVNRYQNRWLLTIVNVVYQTSLFGMSDMSSTALVPGSRATPA